MTSGAEDTTIAEPAFQARVRLRARRYTDWMRRVWRSDGEPGQGLAITHAEVDHALSEPAEQTRAEARFYEDEGRRFQDAIGQADEAFSGDARWARLRAEFGLSSPELDLLCLLVAAETAPALTRVYGYLNDDGQACHGSPWLASKLFQWPPEAAIGHDSTLVRWRLAWPSEAATNPWGITSPWLVDAGLVGWLTAGTLADPALGGAVEVVFRASLAGVECLYPDQLASMRDHVRSLQRGRVPLQLEIVGPEGSGRSTLGAQACAALDRDMVKADASALFGPEPLPAASDRGARVLRLARLLGAAVYWDNADRAGAGIWASLPAAELTLFGTSSPLAATPQGVSRRAFRLPELPRAERVALWSRLTNAPAPALVADWKLRPSEIASAALSAPAGPEAVAEACREALYQAPGELFTPLECPYTWEHIVLSRNTSDHLEELEAQARLRSDVFEGWGFEKLFPLGRGLTALFAGPSGTGKTMAAQVIARVLGMELYRVDLAGVVNKYIGETEKRLKQVFDACERSNVLLFFDEADALFGQRMQVKDAHDRFANIEIDYLLQRMEQFDGIAILATNRKSDIDKAFLRRLRFVVDFVHPGPAERRRLWHLALPERSPAGDELLERIDWDLLAEKLPFTGADIKNAGLAAAFLARKGNRRIGMAQVLAASRRELTKHGNVLRPGDWED